MAHTLCMPHNRDASILLRDREKRRRRRWEEMKERKGVEDRVQRVIDFKRNNWYDPKYHKCNEKSCSSLCVASVLIKLCVSHRKKTHLYILDHFSWTPGNYEIDVLVWSVTHMSSKLVQSDLCNKRNLILMCPSWATHLAWVKRQCLPSKWQVR